MSFWHSCGRSPRVFTRWSQFVCLAFIHLAARPSMRDCIRNLDATTRRLYHLGVKPVARSIVSDANNKRPAESYKRLFGAVNKRCEKASPGHRFRFKNKLFSLDASTIKLNLASFPWAEFRTNRGGIKLHTLLDHDGYIPAFVHVTNVRRHEAKWPRRSNCQRAPLLPLIEGT